MANLHFGKRNKKKMNTKNDDKNAKNIFILFSMNETKTQNDRRTNCLTRFDCHAEAIKIELFLIWQFPKTEPHRKF